VGDVLPAQQAQEVGLAAAVRAQDRQALAVEDLEVERRHEAGQLEPAQVRARTPCARP
jgi:hypothetical protein